MPHVVLLLLVAGEDADLADVGLQETPQHGVAEGAGAAGDQQRLAFEHRRLLACKFTFSYLRDHPAVTCYRAVLINSSFS